jgi:glycosyltransferase involved in cell wall biosynthesis
LGWWRWIAANGEVLAGIDDEEWNPATDKHIAEKYSVHDFPRGKAANKAALQKELGLPERPEVPLVGFIGRLDYQKGADLVLAAAPWLISQDVQLVCLGTGESGLEVHTPPPLFVSLRTSSFSAWISEGRTGNVTPPPPPAGRIRTRAHEYDDDLKVLSGARADS